MGHCGTGAARMVSNVGCYGREKRSMKAEDPNRDLLYFAPTAPNVSCAYVVCVWVWGVCVRVCGLGCWWGVCFCARLG